MKKYYVKEIYGCRSCPNFCGEGEFCHHPKWSGHAHVVKMYKDGVFMEDFTFPEDCPLPDDITVVCRFAREGEEGRWGEK